jgi:hypothetical protein
LLWFEGEAIQAVTPYEGCQMRIDVAQLRLLDAHNMTGGGFNGFMDYHTSRCSVKTADVPANEIEVTHLHDESVERREPKEVASK